MTASVIVLLVLSLILGGYVLFSLRTDGWRKWAGPVLYGAVLASSVWVIAQSMGRPIPYWAMIEKLNGDVIGVKFIEDVAILVWVAPKDGSDPISIRLPWDFENAKEAAAMVEQGDPIAYDGDYEKPIHPKPPEALPPK